ncbi:hypothetical protein [Variovorax paradoxus]|uniref:Carboxypeptidase regulatory-like domain-containing protein n=1 Tax=Variovorax paradoxus TaxID=34073 RepID=A0A0H2M2I4_VARPD|nr:hypothetical protein [Variovorax paradoxus]KLN56638.1 hypothetical protein VPARA_22170 [Variovorax paradoxus]
MTTRISSHARPLAAATLCGAVLLAALSSSAHAAFNPPIRMTHGIEYMSGGIGSDEAKLMETVAPRWPATFEFAIKDHKGAEFASDVRVTVRDSHGAVLLDNVESAGPFMVARLDPGTYEVEARLRGNTLKQTLQVMPGAPARVAFLWPAGTDMASAGTRTVR